MIECRNLRVLVTALVKSAGREVRKPPGEVKTLQRLSGDTDGVITSFAVIYIA